MRGYVGIGHKLGKFIPKNQALAYALRKTGIALADPSAPFYGEFCTDFEDWFYSCSWFLGEQEEEVTDDDPRYDNPSPGMAVLPVPPAR